jgi:3-methyladenine DNA glycosylase/8-oxoguanine DNA glycosylase
VYHLAKRHFQTVDPKLFEASLKHDIADIVASGDLFGDLIFAIVNQQLSGKAAETIYNRLEKKLGKKGVTPKSIKNISSASMRACGLSESKAKAMKGFADAVLKGNIDLIKIIELPDVEVIEALTSLKGIGPWTAEMILMHSLGRTDIFSAGDLGLRKGIMRLYGLKKMPSDKTIVKLSKKWSPYRTYAAKVIWRVADEGKN